MAIQPKPTQMPPYPDGSRNVRPELVPTAAVVGSRDSDLHSGVPSEQERELEYRTISWKAIFAGTFISLLTYGILMSLGMAIGGVVAQGLISGGNDLQSAGIGSGIWIIASVLISPFVGSYASGRVAGLIPMRIGRAQGAVITALFFALMLSQIGNAIGLLGQGLGSAVGTAGTAATDVAQSPQVQEIVDRVIGDTPLRSPPDTVIQGLATRLVRGDQQGAITYLSRQTGITREEATLRFESVQADIQNTLREAGTTTAKVISTAGWTLFGAMTLGLIASLIGGGLGAGLGLRRPVARDDRKVLQKAA